MTVAATFVFLAAASAALLYARYRLRARPSVSLLLFAALLVVHVIPMMIYLHVTGPDTFVHEAVLQSVDASAVISTMLCAMACMFIFIIVGVEFAYLIAPRGWVRSLSASRGHSHRKLASVYRAPPPLRIALWMIAAAMVCVIVAEGQIASIFRFYASGESAIEKMLFRHDEGGTHFYAYNVFLYSVAPFVVMILRCMHIANPKDRELTVLMCLFFLLVLIGKLGTLSKAPPVIFLLQMALLSLLLKGKALEIWPITKLLLLTAGLFAAVALVAFPDIEPWSVIGFLYYRTFDIPNQILLEYFSAFPQKLNHGWEYGIFGSMSRDSGEVVLPNYSAVAEITRGTLLSTSNSMFVGDAWANYVWPGVITTSFAVGCVVRMIDLYSLRRGLTHEWACLIAGCSFGIFTAMSTAFSTALITGGLLLIPLVSALFSGRTTREKNDATPRPRGTST